LRQENARAITGEERNGGDLCGGDFQNGGMYCIGFGGATVDRRFSELLLISPYWIEASLKAIENINLEVDHKSAVFQKQLQQLEYEAQRAFERYNAVDARNRLVAGDWSAGGIRNWKSWPKPRRRSKKSLINGRR
jgi:hypothetical protein